jgi:hypothetical protein
MFGILQPQIPPAMKKATSAKIGAAVTSNAIFSQR